MDNQYSWNQMQMQMDQMQIQMQIQMQMQLANQTLWDAQKQAQQNIDNSRSIAKNIIENAKVEANQIINQAKENIKLLKTAEEQSITYVNDILAKCEIEIKKMVDPLGEEQKFIVLAKLKKLNLLPDNTLSFIEYQRLVKLYTV